MPNQNSSPANYIRTAEKGTVLFREGDTDVEMYFVLKGEVELSKTSGTTVLTASLIGQGEFFGEMSFIPGESRRNTAITTCDTVLMSINSDNFNEVISKNPQLAQHIITRLCLRLRNLTNCQDEAHVQVSDNEEKFNGSTETAPIPETIVPDTDTPVPDTDTPVPDTDTPVPDMDTPETGSFEAVGKADVLSNKTFELTADDYNKYCFTKEVTCPVCDHKFNTDMLRESRLNLKGRSDELRIFYEDINPLFYNVWVCPNCYYSMKRTDFDKITEIQKRNLANQSAQRKENWKLDFSNKFSFDFAVTAYKIAIECCDSLGKKNIEDRIAGLWLNTAWLYDDMDQPDNALEARKNALVKYKNAYIFGTDRTDEQDQKIEYLVGKLSWVTGNLKEARDHFFKVVNRRGGHQLLRQMARDALDQLKPLL